MLSLPYVHSLINFDSRDVVKSMMLKSIEIRIRYFFSCFDRVFMRSCYKYDAEIDNFISS